jgi:hypothetical protein
MFHDSFLLFICWLFDENIFSRPSYRLTAEFSFDGCNGARSAPYETSSIRFCGARGNPREGGVATHPKRLAFSSAVLILEEKEELFGDNPWGHRLTPQNRVVLEKFIQCANEQGYIPSRPPLSNLFAPMDRGIHSNPGF